MRYLTIALAKGRLANHAVDLFEKIGITCDEIKDKDTRKLYLPMKNLRSNSSYQSQVTYLHM